MYDTILLECKILIKFFIICPACHQKKKKYANWRKDKSTEAWEECKKSKQNTKKVISLAKGKKQRECARDLNDPNQQNEIF